MRTVIAEVHSPGQDQRVREIAELLDSGKYELLSLDLFDTLLWRMCPTPRDLFFELARAVEGQGGLRASSSRSSFVRERIEAEMRARTRSESGEVTLDEIYEEFPRGYLQGLVPGHVARMEFEIERALVRVDPNLKALVDQARERGMKVAFVSDTYFNRRQVLELVGFRPDHLLLSSESQLSKHQGLHRELLDRSGLPPDRILHVGDDHAADIEGPAVWKLDRYWYRKFPDAFAPMVQSELPGPLDERARVLCGTDLGLTKLRSRALFTFSDPYERWGAGVLGPIICGFADWVLRRCREEGIATALCLMREGRILKQVIDMRAGSLVTRECYLSRYSARKASIFKGSVEEIGRFVCRPSPISAARLGSQLGLTNHAAIHQDPDRPLEPEEIEEVVRRIAGDSNLRKEVVESSRRARAGLLAHLESLIQLDQSEKVAIVDLGYSGTMQACLDRILRWEGIALETRGLYLVTGGSVSLTQAAGTIAEGWLAENGQPISMAHTFMRSPEIVEQSLMSDCGSTRGHDESGSPVLEEIRVPSGQREQIRRIQRGVIRFSESWFAHCASEGTADTSSLRELFREICIRSVARPTYFEVDLFGSWEHDENFGSASSRGLTDSVGLGSLEQTYISPHQIASLPSSKLYWPFGYASKIGSSMAEAVAQIFLRRSDPTAFDSPSGTHAMVFYWDAGAGFRRGQSVVREFPLNNRGRSWQRFTLQMKGGSNRHLGFSIGVPGQIVGLGGLKLHFQSNGSPSWEREYTTREIVKEGYRHLHGNLYLVETDPALLIVRTEELERFEGTVMVDLFVSIVEGE